MIAFSRFSYLTFCFVFLLLSNINYPFQAFVQHMAMEIYANYLIKCCQQQNTFSIDQCETRGVSIWPFMVSTGYTTPSIVHPEVRKGWTLDMMDLLRQLKHIFPQRIQLNSSFFFFRVPDSCFSS